MIEVTQKEIEMFAKAIDIQEMWRPSVGDVFISRIGHPTIVAYIDPMFPRIINTPDTMRCVEQGYNLNFERMIWIPSQEQLRDIFGNGHAAQIAYLYDFLHGYDVYPDGVASTFWNGTDAWIALVMCKRFNKGWNGNDWETIE